MCSSSGRVGLSWCGVVEGASKWLAEPNKFSAILSLRGLLVSMLLSRGYSRRLPLVAVCGSAPWTCFFTLSSFCCFLRLEFWGLGKLPDCQPHVWFYRGFTSLAVSCCLH